MDFTKVVLDLSCAILHGCRTNIHDSKAFMQYKEKKNKKTAKSVSVRHKIWEMILRIPKETSVVRAELEALGISQDKIKRWKKNACYNVSHADLVVLMNYFSKYPETGVSKIDDLLEVGKTKKAPNSHKIKDL